MNAEDIHLLKRFLGLERDKLQFNVNVVVIFINKITFSNAHSD